tara:strand:+ start:685 stop:1344 length:660 start_codon:yes stop_codon:yes gene_type:complete
MAENTDTPHLPDLRLTCDARLPANLRNRGVTLGECTICSSRLCESINLAGCDGGSEYICIPCVANFYDDDDIPYDDWDKIDLPFTDATIAKYNLQPMGVNQTLDCGCILTDMTAWMKPNTTWQYITVCTPHRIWCEPKILMSDVWGSPKDECFHCDEWFSEKTMMLGGNDSNYCLDCYTKIHLAKPICLRCGYYSEGPCLSATGDLCSPKPVNYGVDLS